MPYLNLPWLRIIAEEEPSGCLNESGACWSVMQIVYFLFVPKFKFYDGVMAIYNVRLTGYHRKRRGTENILRQDSGTEITSLMQNDMSIYDGKNARPMEKCYQSSKHEVLGNSDIFGHKQVEKTVGSVCWKWETTNCTGSLFKEHTWDHTDEMYHLVYPLLTTEPGIIQMFGVHDTCHSSRVMYLRRSCQDQPLLGYNMIRLSMHQLSDDIRFTIFSTSQLPYWGNYTY